MWTSFPRWQKMTELRTLAFVEETEDGGLLLNGEPKTEEDILKAVKEELDGLRDFMDIGEGKYCCG